MMKITLYTAPIFNEVRQKSHLEVQSIKDAEDRDNARAGVEKTDEISRCVDASFGQLARMCNRFLVSTYWSAVDDLGTLPETYSFEFAFSERRGVSKAEPLTKAMHAYAVQFALSQFCLTVNQKELAAGHMAEADNLARQIDELLYTKLPPIV